MSSNSRHHIFQSKNTYGQLVQKVPNLEVKHGCELVIIGIAAMQSYSDRRDPQL